MTEIAYVAAAIIGVIAYHAVGWAIAARQRPAVAALQRKRYYQEDAIASTTLRGLAVMLAWPITAPMVAMELRSHEAYELADPDRLDKLQVSIDRLEQELGMR